MGRARQTEAGPREAEAVTGWGDCTWYIRALALLLGPTWALRAGVLVFVVT